MDDSVNTSKTSETPTFENPEISASKKPKKYLKVVALTLIALVIFLLGLYIQHTFQNYKRVKEEEKYDIVVTGFENVSKTKSAPENINSVIDANNQFALDYYSLLKDNEDSNIFFSPLSISNALAMTYEGARNKTAEEMLEVFYFPQDDNLRRTSYKEMLAGLNEENSDYELSIANALWTQSKYKFLDDFINVVEKFYDGKATDLDFATDSENSRLTINNWVEEHTNNKIKNLIPKGVINGLTRLILTNAIYFKGDWEEQFDVEMTKNESFRISKEDTVEVPMMQRTDENAKFKYFENDNLQIVELPYKGRDLSMLILLPRDSMVWLENTLSLEKLSEWKRAMLQQRVDVYIPRFKFETKYFMKDDLATMGMPTAFSDFADFSGMDGGRNLFISKVIHQAYVEVNEEGTEAAAATAVVMMLGDVGIPEVQVFKADHPFIFMIQDNNNGNILFIGKVVDPTL